MKQKFLSILLISLAILFVGCSPNDSKTITGQYNFVEVVYLSPLSSSTKDYVKKQMEDTKYIIDKNSFEIISQEKSTKYDNIKIERVKMNNDEIKKFNDGTFEEVDISNYKEKYQYSLYDKDGKEIKYYLYLMDNEVWIASYNDKNIIMSIYKLKKMEKLCCKLIAIK